MSEDLLTFSEHDWPLSNDEFLERLRADWPVTRVATMHLEGDPVFGTPPSDLVMVDLALTERLPEITYCPRKASFDPGDVPLWAPVLAWFRRQVPGTLYLMYTGAPVEVTIPVGATVDDILALRSRM